MLFNQREGKCVPKGYETPVRDRDGSAPRYSAKPTQFEAARSKRGSQAAGKMRPSFTPVQTLPRKLTMLGPGVFNVYTNAV